ncbi:DUF6894 family protein [Phenylobacterium sp.]|uniref:DUF6894 family protein n=1 Tax=Phenylobacterium sp. TaxID=1871053 RepID=UPI002F91CA32
MPRYHFNLEDGESVLDPEGTELPNLTVARSEAVRMAGRLLEDNPASIWAQGDWRMVVTDDAGVVLFTLSIAAMEAAENAAANDRR